MSDGSSEQLQRDGWCALHNVIPHDVAIGTRYDLYRIGTTCGVIAQGYNSNLPYIPFYTRVSVIKDCQRFAPHLIDPRVMSIVTAAIGPRVCITATTMQIHEPQTPRGPWHVGEPFDSTSTSLLKRDAITHLSLVWMFSPFSIENGGYLLLPGSHHREKPADSRVEPQAGELTATGTFGTVILTDSRLWRAIAANEDDLMRISVTIGFASLPESGDAPRDAKSVLAPAVFDRLPADVKPLFRHWVTPPTS